MAAITEALPAPASRSAWFWDFLKEELAPYPGRFALVARMVIAATLVMIICMTFKMPEGAYGCIYALILSREHPKATVQAVKTVVIMFSISALYEVIGAMFFVNEPNIRLLWVVITFFLMFYFLSALTNYTAAMRFGYLVIITTPLWDQYIGAEARVEGTLWAVWTMTIASIITAVIELVYGELNPGAYVIRPITERLGCVEDLIRSYVENRPVAGKTQKDLTRFVTIGLSRARRDLQRSSYPARYREQMSAVVALVARVIDIAANLSHLDVTLSDAERDELRPLLRSIAQIHADLERGVPPHALEPQKANGVTTFPLLREMETTVSLIPEIFVGSHSLKEYAPSGEPNEAPARLFKADAFSNFDHIKFALRGCMAASICYIIYNAIDWPGISTAVTTCFLTALTTVGSSRQKQLLRISGTFTGGIILGIGSQIFLLPHLDSIAGFMVLFIAVTSIAAWFATCTPRLSYFGVQIAVAWYLINLQEFKIQTSLSEARDRVFGILLGLFVMWVVFDQLWAAPAAVGIKNTLASGLRLLAQYAREPVSKDSRAAIDRSFALRETISAAADKVRSLADGMLFEFGPTRNEHLELRNRIRKWQTEARLIFIMQTTLWKYRMRLPGFDMPDAVLAAQAELDHELATTLDATADRLEGKSARADSGPLQARLQQLEQAVRDSGESLQSGVTAQLDPFLTLARREAELTTALSAEI